MRERLNFKFTVDLSNGGSTPHFKVDVYTQSGDLHQGDGTGYPEFQCDTMPILYSEGDTIEFCFDGRNITSCNFYARPVEKTASRPSPFNEQQWHQEIFNDSKIIIPLTNYYWTFAISGVYQISGEQQGGGENKMPFLIDPDCHIIGRKRPNYDTQVELPILPYPPDSEGVDNFTMKYIEFYNQSEIAFLINIINGDYQISGDGSDEKASSYDGWPCITTNKTIKIASTSTQYKIAKHGIHRMVLNPVPTLPVNSNATYEYGGFVVFLP